MRSAGRRWRAKATVSAGEGVAMTTILRIRARRFHALYAILTGDAGALRHNPDERASRLPYCSDGERPVRLSDMCHRSRGDQRLRSSKGGRS